MLDELEKHGGIVTIEVAPMLDRWGRRKWTNTLIARDGWSYRITKRQGDELLEAMRARKPET